MLVDHALFLLTVLGVTLPFLAQTIVSFLDAFSISSSRAECQLCMLRWTAADFGRRCFLAQQLQLSDKDLPGW